MIDTVQNIALLDFSPATGPAGHGREVLARTLQEQQITINEVGPGVAKESLCLVVGLVNHPQIGPWLRAHQVDLRPDPEGVIFWWRHTLETDYLVVAGTDERGLMYAQLEAADRLQSGGLAALTASQNLVEYPETAVRGVDRFIMGPLDDEWFLSEAFWHYYLARLARCRFNRFVLITGFDTAYFSPPYPFFVEVPGYPEVQPIGLDPARRAQNLSQLKRIATLCHAYGLDFVLATWQQTPWTQNQEKLVAGLPEAELALGRYCGAGLTALLKACPEIDGLHFRVNLEAGIGDATSNEAFWKECIWGIAAANPKINLELRAKGLTDGMIAFAQSCGFAVDVSTKYWCEHTGLPYHLTQMRQEELSQLENLNHSRRYSYADLLKKPRTFDLLYRLWNQGSTTLFLWGDPDYARRFVKSLRLGPAIGFEIGAPLGLKGGQALLQQTPWTPFRRAELRSGRWEDERYWLWYLVFGRLGYHSGVEPAIWQREFAAHFGPAAPHLERALRAGSRVLPLITAAHMPVHPMLHYWTEMSTGAALFAEHNFNSKFGSVSYGTTEPSDPGLFYRIIDFVTDQRQGRLARKYTPFQVSDWLQHLAGEIEAGLAEITEEMRLPDQAEFAGAHSDLLMLQDLALYHAAKIRAAVALADFEASQETESLQTAYRYGLLALSSWRSLARRGQENYSDQLQFNAGNGFGRHGTWADRLPEIEQDVTRLEEMLQQVGALPLMGGTRLAEPDRFYSPAFTWSRPETARPGQDYWVEVRLGPLANLRELKLHYRHTNQLAGPFQEATLLPHSDAFRGCVPGAYVDPAWDLLLYFSGLDPAGQPVIWPGLFHPEHALPYFIIVTGAQ
jgi:hypothetical protein